MRKLALSTIMLCLIAVSSMANAQYAAQPSAQSSPAAHASMTQPEQSAAKDCSKNGTDEAKKKSKKDKKAKEEKSGTQAPQEDAPEGQLYGG